MKRLLFILLTAALILAGCGASPIQRSFDMTGAPAAEPSMPEMYEAPMEAPAPADGVTSNATGGGFEPAAIERIVIQNADLSIVVIDPEAKMDEIARMAEDMGGFVVSKNVYQTTTGNNIRVPAGNITVRVPAEDLDEALDQIKADAVEVQNENRSGQDVTRDYRSRS